MEPEKQLDERAGLPSASAWRRYELCAGSYQLETQARRLGQLAFRSSPEATRGERIHAWLADEGSVKLSAEEQETAECLKARAEEQIRRIFGEEPVKVLKERRLWLVKP